MSRKPLILTIIHGSRTIECVSERTWNCDIQSVGKFILCCLQICCKLQDKKSNIKNFYIRRTWCYYNASLHGIVFYI